MECYDESLYCHYCNLKFSKEAKDRVEHEDRFWHKDCLSWVTRPKGPPVVSIRKNSEGR